MNRSLLTLFVLMLVAPMVWAQVQYSTEKPRVDDINDPDVAIKRIELTDKYTIIYMKFESAEKKSKLRPMPFDMPFPGDGRDGSGINFQPTARLYVNQGEHSYKFIRAENIPSIQSMRIQPGDRVDFVVYFERIAPGYTKFDLFECKDSRTTTCFNFWGVHVINPLKKTNLAQRKPAPKPPVAPKPEPPAPTPAPQETPTPTDVAINGITRNAKTKGPIGATVTYRLLSGAEASGDDPADSVRSVDETGAYTIPIGRRGVYVLTASAKGYFSRSDTLATNRVAITRDFNLIPIEVGTKVTLKNIYFNMSRFDLKPESYPELDRLATMMQTNPTMQIRLEGHTDTVGDFDANVELSRNRVSEVKRYLVSKGISATRIETIGYGPSRPLNTNKSLKERPENRRVEMVVVKV